MTNDSGDRTISPAGHTVGAVASLVGVTIRTLHHWDAIDLIRPSERTPGGYRLYSASDISRVHRVLFYRELGLPLDDALEPGLTLWLCAVIDANARTHGVDPETATWG